MYRREFLAWSATAAIGSLCGRASNAAATPRQWRLAVEPGLFECDQIVTTADQMRFAAEHGFCAFVDDGWLHRTPHERAELKSVARECGIVWGPFRSHMFSDDRRELETAFDEAESLSVRAVRVECPFDAAGRADLLVALELAASAAAKRALTLLVEPWSMSYDLASFVAENHPGLGLSADVYRLAASGHNVVHWMKRMLPWIGHIELADFPCGLEPGTGRLDIPRICALLDEQGYAGVVGLRHGRSQSGRAGIDAVLRACQRIEPSIMM